jgi:hypothetical protein
MNFNKAALNLKSYCPSRYTQDVNEIARNLEQDFAGISKKQVEEAVAYANSRGSGCHTITDLWREKLFPSKMWDGREETLPVGYKAPITLGAWSQRKKVNGVWGIMEQGYYNSLSGITVPSVFTPFDKCVKKLSFNANCLEEVMCVCNGLIKEDC